VSAQSAASREDPDFDLWTRRLEVYERPIVVLLAISSGGALGALARYGVGTAFPYLPGGMPLATMVVNVSGCLLIGMLLTLITGDSPAHRLLRPFLGVGVLGGYTTFSTYVLDIQQALAAGNPPVALVYLGLTLVLGLLAVWAGLQLAQGLHWLYRSGRRTGGTR